MLLFNGKARFDYFKKYASTVPYQVRRMKQSPIIHRSRGVTLGLILAVLATVIAVAVSGMQSRAQQAPICTLTDKLENPCRPLLGGFSLDSGSLIADIEGKTGVSAGLEPRTGKKLEVVRAYIPRGKWAINKESKYFIDRPDTILFTNYKPSVPWREADGRSADINGQIDQMADSINMNVPAGKKIMLSIDAEPEDDMSELDAETSAQCPNQAIKAKTQSGTPKEYRDMWRNVRTRFDAKGVSGKVVWVMNYMGYKNWDCLVKAFYPGDNLVDWITWDPYISDGSTWDQEVGRFYRLLEQQTDENHQFTAKPWGLSEFGSWHTNQAQVYKMYNDAQAAAEVNLYPRLKLYAIFDAAGSLSSKVEYVGNTSQKDPTELAEYSRFANSKAFVNPVELPLLPVSLPAPAPTDRTVTEPPKQDSAQPTSPTVPVTQPVAAAGLQASYYSDSNRIAAPKQRVDQTINFDWKRGAPIEGVGSDNFNVRWTGQLTVPQTDNYVLTLKGDDGFKMWIDGKLVIDGWKLQAVTAYRTKWLKLEANKKHDIVIEYYEQTGLASLKLSWQAPSLPKAVIPASALTH